MEISELDSPTTVKDLLLTCLLMLAISGLAYAYRQYQRSQVFLKKLIADIEGLAKAEETLKSLHETFQVQNSNPRRPLPVWDQGPGEDTAAEVSRLREEVEVLRSELVRAETQLEDKCWEAPPSLQQWLLQTYEIELQVYGEKKKTAEQQLDSAKELYEKLKKKRFSLLGAFVSTHSGSIGDVDRSILEAKGALLDLAQDLSERTQRWRHIETLCGFQILTFGSCAQIPNIPPTLEDYTFDDSLSVDDSQIISTPTRNQSFSVCKSVSRESSKESTSSDDVQLGKRSCGCLRRYSSSSSFSISLSSPPCTTPPTGTPSRRLMPKVGPGGRMMVKSFSQDGYSPASRIHSSGLQRQKRVVSAAASNETLSVMQGSVSEDLLVVGAEASDAFQPSISFSSSLSIGEDLAKPDSVVNFYDDNSVASSTTASSTDLAGLATKTKTKLFFNLGSKRERLRDII